MTSNAPVIWAMVLERRPMKPAILRGTFGFQQIPSPSDHIQILNERELIDLMQVLYVQHTPAHLSEKWKVEQPLTHIICDVLNRDIPLPPYGVLSI